MEATQMSIDRWMDNNVVYTYNGVLYSVIKKKEIMLLAATWMELKIIILGDVSQKEKDKYRIISLISEI